VSACRAWHGKWSVSGRRCFRDVGLGVVPLQLLLPGCAGLGVGCVPLLSKPHAVSCDQACYAVHSMLQLLLQRQQQEQQQ
jgi:hypothetical protein